MDEIIKAPFLDGLAKLKKLEDRQGYYILEVVLVDNNQFRTIRITEDEYNKIETVEDNPITLADNSEDFFYLIEANRIRMAYQFDPFLAVSVSQVDPLPHQIEAVYDYALESPKLRFLIADDPGAGKTIMAGLILKELQHRKMANRILIVAPGHLKYQWQRELKEKFQSNFGLVDRGVMRSAWSENVWEEKNHLITSIDFIKQDDIKSTLRNVHWDLIIVDEAHKMSAYAYESKNKTKIDKTKRYQVGEILSDNTDHLLFLTATPHKGDEENFRLFLDLLRPGFFAKKEILEESVNNNENSLFIRRMKEDMETFKGEKLFPPRHVKTIQFNLTKQEYDLYNEVTDYVQNYFDKASDNRHIVFAMIILQRRLSSSIHAVYKSLKRRKVRLQELLDLPEKIKNDQEFEDIKNLSQEEIEDMEEEERWRIEEKLEKLTYARNINDVKLEIEKLENLISKAEEVKELEVESKLTALRDTVLTTLGNKKLLIFTEFKDTLFYLTEKLENWGYNVITIHGGMNQEARVEAEKKFKNNSQIMVATEAAGEGINLQFCSLMINYDIPWNPNRLEQRMGRIHRYGQTEEVYIWNMISKDTMEGRVLNRLFTKLDRMREALGSDRVFDIISDVIPGDSLDNVLKNAISKQRSMDEIENEINSISESDIKDVLDRVYLSSLATRHIDYSGIIEKTKKAEENRLVPEYVEDYFLRVFKKLDGNLSKIDNNGIYKISNVPFKLRKYNDNYDFKNEYGEINKRYNKITFEKDILSIPKLFYHNLI